MKVTKFKCKFVYRRNSSVVGKTGWNILVRRGNNRFPSTTVAKQQKRTPLIDGFRWKRFGVRKTECHEQTE